MDALLRLIAKLTIIVGIGIGIVLIFFIGVLVFWPEKLFELLYYILILFCAIAFVYIVINVIRIGCTYFKKRNAYRGSGTIEKKGEEVA